MARYILLQKNRAKAPLLGTKSKPYKVQIDKDISFNWYLMDEAWLVTNVYLGNKNTIAQSLRATHPDIGPNEINKFIEIVKTDHPLEYVDFKWDDIPLYATAKSYCELTLPWLYKVPIKLTQEQEKELLGIIQDDGYDKKSRMINWFYRYRCDYGIDARLKRDRETQDEDLAEMFCMVHGFDLFEIQSILVPKKKGLVPKKQADLQNTISNCIIFSLCSLVFLIPGGWNLIMSKGDSFSEWIVCILLPMFIVSALSLIVIYVQLRKKGCIHVWEKGCYEAWRNIRAFIILFAIIMIPFGLLLLGQESDSWLVGILCAIPFFLVLGLIRNLMKRQ